MRSPCLPSFRLATFSGLFLLSVSGCASDAEHVDKRLATLQEEITRIQSQTDRMSERLDAVELKQVAAPKPDQRTAEASAGTLTRPKLKVVRLEPDQGPIETETVAAPAEDPNAPRVVIQGEGKDLQSRTLPAPAPAKTPATRAPAKPAP